MKVKTAVSDHEAPREFDTSRRAAHIGNSPSDAIRKLAAADRRGLSPPHTSTTKEKSFVDTQTDR